MITYEPFWNTLKNKNVSKYQLIYYWNISSNTLRRMSHNEPISTVTINTLCLILNCTVEDILQFDTSEEELQEINKRKEEISAIKKRHKK